MIKSMFNNNLISFQIRITMESQSDFEDNEFEDDFDDELGDSEVED